MTNRLITIISLDNHYIVPSIFTTLSLLSRKLYSIFLSQFVAVSDLLIELPNYDSDAVKISRHRTRFVYIDKLFNKGTCKFNNFEQI